jgi:hypothetical protein
MIMKKLAISFTLILFIVSNNIQADPQKIIESDTIIELTLKEAIEVAHKEAIKWNKDAMLFNGLSVDRDETQKGMDGRRKHWNIQFGIPGKIDWYLVTIRNGKVDERVHLPDELDKMSEEYFIHDVNEFNHDTPELIQKGQQITEIYPGDVFAKGYHFGFTKDPQKNIPLVMVIGWDKTRENMIYLMFNAKTGKLEEELVREQYKN